MDEQPSHRRDHHGVDREPAPEAPDNVPHSADVLVAPRSKRRLNQPKKPFLSRGAARRAQYGGAKRRGERQRHEHRSSIAATMVSENSR